MPQAPINIACPDVETLATYVTGRLGEAEASTLSDHLDQCPQCQRATDEMAGQGDSLISALQRRLGDTLGSDFAQLSSLIAGAAKIQAEAGEKRKSRKSTDEPVPLDEFIVCLRKSRLVDPSEMDVLVDEFSSSETLAMARTLVARDILTPFQAKALVRGKYRGLVLGNYAVLEKLGEGGMGQVFKARHLRMDRVVCLKVMRSGARKSPEQVARFRREAETVAALSHPNIVVAHDADEADGIPYLVMECIDGIDLARYVEKHGPLPAQQATELVTQVACALDYAHGRGVIHRDIKPHNLMLDAEGNVKILDMGLVRLDAFLDGPSDVVTQAAMTSTGAIMGTVDYISPEQALNSRNADSRSDIYSLGCTLHYLVTGKVVFDGETIMEKLIAHREHAVPAMADSAGEISLGLEAVFSKMVSKAPEDRYAAMADLVEDLKALAAGRTPVALSSLPASVGQVSSISGALPSVVESPPVASRRQAESASRRPRIWAAIAGCLLFTVMIGAWVTNWGDRFSNTLVETAPEAAPEAVLPFPNLPPTLLANEGPGRVLVVLPYAWFYEEQYEPLVNVLKTKGIDYVVASSQTGQARPKHGKIGPVDVNMNLADFRSEDFDAVVFLGGNVAEFRHKGVAEETTHELVKSLLTRQQVVASIGNGWDAVNDVVNLDGCVCDYKNVDGVEVGTPKDKKWRGRVAKAKGGEQSESLLTVMLERSSRPPKSTASVQ